MWNNKRFISVILLVVMLLGVFCSAGFAEKKTGYKKGDVIKTEYSNTSRAHSYTSVKGYVKSKDIYVSEKYISNAFVEYAPKSMWLKTEEDPSYAIGFTRTIKASGASEIIKKLGLKVTLEVSFAASATSTIKPVKANGKYCRPCIRISYIEVTYTHETYNSSGKKTGSETRTVKAPVPNTQMLCWQYKNSL